MNNNLKIALFFFAATIAGTLYHECGHAVVAWLYGFHPKIHASSCTPLSKADWAAVEAGTLEYNDHIRMWIRLGGPLQTTLFSLIGMIGLWVLNSRTKIDAWNTKHLFWIVMAYFSSREVFNSAGILIRHYFLNKASRSDEIRLLRYWELPIIPYIWLLLIAFSLVLVYVTFVLVKKHRLQLILFGAIGSAIGAWFWLYSIS